MRLLEPISQFLVVRGLQTMDPRQPAQYNQSVKPLQKFEAWVSHMLESGLANLLGAQLQPVEIAKRLADFMDDHRTLGAGRTYVPNRFRVGVAPKALVKLEAFQAALEDELTRFAIEHARQSDYHFVGRVRVKLESDPQLRSERFRIHADLVNRDGVALQGGPEAQSTQTFAAARADATHPPPGAPTLVLAIGRRRFVLDESRSLTVGRALDNDIILDDPAISRHHARLVPRNGHWLIEDLASNSGVYVNHQRVKLFALRPGDQVRMGQQILLLDTPEPTSMS